MKKLTESCVEVALWHLAHVVLVQELALVALLAEAAKPMLAHDRLCGGGERANSIQWINQNSKLLHHYNAKMVKNKQAS